MEVRSKLGPQFAKPPPDRNMTARLIPALDHSNFATHRSLKARTYE